MSVMYCTYRHFQSAIGRAMFRLWDATVIFSPNVILGLRARAMTLVSDVHYYPVPHNKPQTPTEKLQYSIMKTSVPLSSTTASSARRRITLSPGASANGRPPKMAKCTVPNAPPIFPTPAEWAALAPPPKTMHSLQKTLESESAATQRRLQALRPQSHEELPRTLAFLHHHSELCKEDLESASSKLEDILRQEKTKDGTTLALFYCGGHLDILYALNDANNDDYSNAMTILLMRVLHLLCCRQGYFQGVPEILGVSCLNTSLVYAVAIDTVFASIEEQRHVWFNSSIDIATQQKANTVTIQQGFEIIDALLLGLTLTEIVQLGVPRRSLLCLKQCPTESSVVLAVATLWATLTSECRGASDPVSWVEASSGGDDAPSLLLTDAKDLFTQAQEHFCHDNSDSNVYEAVMKALTNVREIICDDSDEDEGENTVYCAFQEEHNKEN